MDTQTFINSLKQYANRYKTSKQNSEEIFDFLDTNHEVYINATPEDREKIRSFIKEERYDVPHSNITYYMAYLLLVYVKERVIQSLKPAKKLSMLERLKGTTESPDDKAQLLRGLVALSIENNAEGFADASYGYGVSALVLLADLYVTAEERGMKPKKYFQQIASISSNQGSMPMNNTMAGGGDSRLLSERRHFGRFKGMF